MIATRRDLLVDVALLVVGLAVNVWAHDGAGLGLRVLGIVAWFALVVIFVRDLARHDAAKYGTFDLLVACDHHPNGVRYERITRMQLWVLLRGLNPDHHLVWVDQQPLTNWKGRR